MFIEAQLFQCFVDERFNAHSSNYEALLFDELISEVQHKSTPFLIDTMHIHKESDKYCVPPAVPSVEPVRYAAFPVSLDASLLPGIRAVPRLITDDSDLVQKNAMHKKLYNRHWHSLGARANTDSAQYRETWRSS